MSGYWPEEMMAEIRAGKNALVTGTAETVAIVNAGAGQMIPIGADVAQV